MPTPYRILSDDTLNLLADRGDTQALMELGYRAERLGILAELQELAKRLREESITCEHCGAILSAVTWTCVRGAFCPGATQAPSTQNRQSKTANR